jgi:hypothetical protein
MPSVAQGALEVQRNANDRLVLITEELRATRSRLRVHELSPTSLAAAATAHRTLSRLGDIEHECARIREQVRAVEWRTAL